MSKMSLNKNPPIIAIAGANGFIGRILTEEFLQHLNHTKRIKELRLLVRKDKECETTRKWGNQGAIVHVVDYSKNGKDGLLPALKCVDVVISGMLINSDESLESSRVLLDAIVRTGVDVYFPSEFGVNHYSPKVKLDTCEFQNKKAHFYDASRRVGLKVVKILCYSIMEYAFGSRSGLDCKRGVWTIVGTGDTSVGLISANDLGKFTVEAALLSWTDPDKVPDALEIVGAVHSLKQYAAMLDAVTGKKTKFLNISFLDALKKHKASDRFVSVFPLMCEAGYCAVTPDKANGNLLLNPGQSRWKLKTFEEFARETGGVPESP